MLSTAVCMDSYHVADISWDISAMHHKTHLNAMRWHAEKGPLYHYNLNVICKIRFPYNIVNLKKGVIFIEIRENCMDGWYLCQLFIIVLYTQTSLKSQANDYTAQAKSLFPQRVPNMSWRRRAWLRRELDRSSPLS